MPARNYHKLFFHLIWTTKYREEIISAEIEKLLIESLAIKAEEIEVEILQFGCVADHMHLLLRLKSSQSVAQVVKDLKGFSSRHVNTHSKGDNDFLRFRWQEKYGVLSISERDLPVIKNYIKNQKEHHQVRNVDREWERSEYSE